MGDSFTQAPSGEPAWAGSLPGPAANSSARTRIEWECVGGEGEWGNNASRYIFYFICLLKNLFLYSWKGAHFVPTVWLVFYEVIFRSVLDIDISISISISVSISI